MPYVCLVLGFIPPTSGTAYVNGYDIREDIANVRSSLGLCPQHDVLFDTLTVEEHLKFFAKVNEQRCEKIGLRGFQPGTTQTGLYSLRRWLEA